MNEVLNDLKIAINNIEESHYSISRTVFADGKLIELSDLTVTYERNFVNQLNTQFQLHQRNIDIQYDLITQLEVLKPFIYKNEKTEYKIFKTYAELKKIDEKETGEALTTIPDFVIHFGQTDLSEHNQRLILEAKVSSTLNSFDFACDLFKLNIYVDKFNFQNAVYLIVNNDIDLIKKRLKSYLDDEYYMTVQNLEKIIFFIKKDFYSELEEIKLSDLLENL